MANRRAFSGARAKIFFDGSKEVGWGTGVNGQETTQLARVDVLGDIDTQEIEPVGRTVTFSMDVVRILNEPLRVMGIWPEGGTADVINFPAMSVEVYDTVGDKVLYKITGCRPETRGWRVDRGDLMRVNCSFQAIRMTAGDA